jgi:hypothetical protein
VDHGVRTGGGLRILNGTEPPRVRSGRVALPPPRNSGIARACPGSPSSTGAPDREYPLAPFPDLGDDIKVLDARQISDIEKDRAVPEVVILGDVTMYEVVYDDDGNAAGANRFTERALIRETSRGFDALYERGEGFYDFFDREIVPLAPPQGSGTQTGSPDSW